MTRAGKTVLYLVYFVLLIVLAGFIIASFRSHSSTPSKHPAIARPRPQTATSSQQASGTAHKATAAPSASAALADTGPGDVASLFVITTVGGTLAYRRRLVATLRD